MNGRIGGICWYHNDVILLTDLGRVVGKRFGCLFRMSAHGKVLHFSQSPMGEYLVYFAYWHISLLVVIIVRPSLACFGAFLDGEGHQHLIALNLDRGVDIVGNGIGKGSHMLLAAV